MTDEIDISAVVNAVDMLLGVFEKDLESAHGPLPEAARIMADLFPAGLFSLRVFNYEGYAPIQRDFVAPAGAQVVNSVGDGKRVVDRFAAMVPLSRTVFDHVFVADPPVVYSEPNEIVGLLSANCHADQGTGFATALVEKLGLRYYYLFPVRRFGVPVGVVSLLYPRALCPREEHLWCMVARMIGLGRIRQGLRRDNTLLLNAIASTTEPIAVLDTDQRMLVASTGLRRLLPRGEQLNAEQLVLHAHEAWLARSAGQPTVRLVAGATENVPVVVSVEEKYDPFGNLLGSVLRFSVAGSFSSGGELRFSDRELDVLRQVAAGRSTKEIAGAIGRSVHTVQYHRSALRRKLHVDQSALTFQQLAAAVLSHVRDASAGT